MNLGLTISLKSTFTLLGGIVAAINPTTELLLDGQSLNDLANTATYLSTANYTAADSATINGVTATVTRNGVASSLSETHTQGDDIQLVITVTDSNGGTRVFVVNYAVPSEGVVIRDNGDGTSTVVSFPDVQEFNVTDNGDGTSEVTYAAA